MNVRSWAVFHEIHFTFQGLLNCVYYSGNDEKKVEKKKNKKIIVEMSLVLYCIIGNDLPSYFCKLCLIYVQGTVLYGIYILQIFKKCKLRKFIYLLVEIRLFFFFYQVKTQNKEVL